MTTKQPEALRLADAIEDWDMGDWSEREVAATLRTQHALLERARECIRVSTEYRIGNPAFEQAECAITQHLEPK